MRADHEKILRYLQFSPKALAIHEMEIEGMSQNNIGTRLPEMAREGLVSCMRLPGESFKRWKPAQWERNGQGRLI